MWSGIKGKRVFCRLQHECDVAKITGKGTVVAFIPKRLESWAESIVWPRNIGNVAIPPNTDNAQSKSSHSSHHKIWKCSLMRFTKRIASLRNHSFFFSPWHHILDCITRHKLYYIKSESAKHWHRISKAKIWLKYFYFFLAFAFAFFWLVGLFIRQRTQHQHCRHWMNFKRYIYQIEIILANAKWWWSALFSRLRHVVGKFTAKNTNTHTHQIPYQCPCTSQATWYHQYFLPTFYGVVFFRILVSFLAGFSDRQWRDRVGNQLQKLTHRTREGKRKNTHKPLLECNARGWRLCANVSLKFVL